MASTAQTIKFNVGGTHYEVSKSLLENFKDSMLERSASKVWNEGGDEVFIEGNGHRFQYVLDFMRHEKVTLPSSESIDAFLTEMEYYGIACDEEQVHESARVSIPNVRKMLDSMKTVTFANLIAIDIIEQGLSNQFWVDEKKFSYEVKYESVGQFKANDKHDIIKEAVETHTSDFIIAKVDPIIEKFGLKISLIRRTKIIGQKIIGQKTIDNYFLVHFKIVTLA